MTFQFRTIAALSVIALLAACGGSGAGDYRSTGVSAGTADAAFAQCDYEANVAIANNKGTTELDQAVSDSIVQGLTKSKLLKKCMQAKGYAQR